MPKARRSPKTRRSVPKPVKKTPSHPPDRSVERLAAIVRELSLARGPEEVMEVVRRAAERRASPKELALIQTLAGNASAALETVGLARGLEQRIVEKTSELESADKELEAFSYSVSHDLRAPLRAVDGFSQALLEDCGDMLDDQGREHLARVRAAAVRMEELIDGLLGLSRLTRREVSWEPVDLSALAAEAADGLRKAAPDRPVALSIAPGVRVTGDRGLLKTMMENLLGNAWKFTSKTPAPEVAFGTGTAADGEPVYFVRDNGAGFDMALAGKLFSPFQRMHRAEEFPGTGIGLAAVRRIAAKHGGRVWAESAPGVGAAFYFILPEPKDEESSRAS